MDKLDGLFRKGGLKQMTKKDFLSFEEAKYYIHRLEFNSKNDWEIWIGSKYYPSNIPSAPDVIYKEKGWISWEDWLGIENQIGGFSKDFLSFGEAREYVRGLKLRSFSKWIDWSESEERLDNIPFYPDCFYKDQGWISWNDWLGNEDLNK